jgi:hypothetical protein
VASSGGRPPSARRSCVSEAVTAFLTKRPFVARSLRSRRDEADDEDLSRNVVRQARCELER